MKKKGDFYENASWWFYWWIDRNDHLGSRRLWGGYEIGWLAFGVGVIVGIGVRMGIEEDRVGGSLPFLIAVGCATGSILAAKFFTPFLFVMFYSSPTIELDIPFPEDNDIISKIADVEIEKLNEQGKTIQWPKGHDDDDTPLDKSYPKEIWKAAATEWNALSEEEKTTRKEVYNKELKEEMKQFAEMFSPTSSDALRLFYQSFNWKDVFFFGLAAFTAFRTVEDKTG